MQLLATILRNLDEAYEKRAWHGTNLRGALRGLTAEEAWYRPAPLRHNIYELTVHAAYWKYAVRRRLTGEKRGSFALKGSNWLAAPPRPDEAAWRAVVALLQAEHRALREVIAALDESRLENPKTLGMLLGIAAHDLYHCGQIQLIKRLARD